MTTITKALILWILFLASAACGGTQQPLDDSGAAEQLTLVPHLKPHEPGKVAEVDSAMARAGVAQARIGDGAMARAGEARASTRGAVATGEGKTERDHQSEDYPSKVTLKVAGDQGIAFSGVCSVGGRAELLEGRTPERHTYDLDGGKLECKIQKASAGTLEVVLTGGGIHAVQRSNAQGGTVRFALSGASVTSSTSSAYHNQTIEASQESLANYYR